MREVDALRERYETFGGYGDRELLRAALIDLLVYRERVGLSDDYVEPDID